MLAYLAFVSAVACLLVVLLRRVFGSSSLPPGPRPIPFVGNVLDMLKPRGWATYYDLAKQYGDVIYLSALGQPMIILNSHTAAVDILAKQSAISSNRPEFLMAGPIAGTDRLAPLMQYDHPLKTMRRHFIPFIGTQSSTHLWEVAEQLTQRFIKRLRKDVETSDSEGFDPRDSISWAASAISLRLIYGYDSAVEDDILVHRTRVAFDSFLRANEPSWTVNWIPPLRHIPPWFPLASFRKIGQQGRKTLDALAREPLEYMKKRMAQGTAPESFSRKLFEEHGASITTEDESSVEWASVTLHGGMANTHGSIVYSFFMAMSLYPEIQKRAQSELDRVLHVERLPSPLDRRMGAFPYINALCKELVRWAPAVPSGVPHVMTETSTYRGWTLPKGTYIIANLWGINRDATIYPNPHKFRPERFLTKAQGGDCETEADIPMDPSKATFGYGRRRCPGQYLAELLIWISVAMTLSVYNIECVKGQEPCPSEYENWVISYPKAFKSKITVRSDEAEKLVNSISNDEPPSWMRSPTERS
ncbi:cytochrome P450 [Sistotremastrum suecicum HHB10207 ss-3]|uniref:Cytochrome P450 n=1 Tax=Sistotremastrum suecicum HHB10207 ss-3 TaxID=1314776 RepID=A0A165XFS9_9AGAM|nr:cytochrome P450 [Sistotremastrum suecicum HHB10207 ss-3]